jgi:hypothetical protein
MNLSSYFPTVISYSPTLSDTAVDSVPEITVRFSIELDAAELNTSDKLARFVRLIEEGASVTTPVEFVSYSSRVLRFKPAVPLTEGATYQVTLLQGLPSFEGREMQADFSFKFKVSANDVPAVELLTPADNTSVSTIPIFTWNAITYDTTGTIQYRIQVDTSTAFNTITEHGWSTTTVETTATPAIALATSTSYFWRVRAEIVTSEGVITGDWSYARTFYLGEEFAPGPSTQQKLADDNQLRIIDASIENGATNLSEFPDLWFVFSYPLAVSGGKLVTRTYIPDYWFIFSSPLSTSGIISITRVPVDGYPTNKQELVDADVEIEESIVTIKLANPPPANTRYCITFSKDIQDINGNTLLTPVSYSFTTWYMPLYVDATVIKASFGAFLLDYPDDVINFCIYRTSLDANRYLLATLSAQNPTEEAVRFSSIMPTFAMERWVEHKASARLLTMYYHEMLKRADSMHRLGDYTEQIGSQLLRDIQAAIKQEEAEALEWFSQFAKRIPSPRTVVRSSKWHPAKKYDDISSTQFIRDIHSRGDF